MKRLAAVVAMPIAVMCHAAIAADAAKDMVYVIPDKVLVQLGKTREQANKECPPCERRWREAWAAEGTKNDSTYLAKLRKQTARPADMKPPVAQKGQ
ncbi:hypothetical protein JYK21_06605 [Ralstonia pickettii]|jgi:hypothetical protein|nr:hypothetical protein [Ralstonia pickettii]